MVVHHAVNKKAHNDALVRDGLSGFRDLGNKRNFFVRSSIYITIEASGAAENAMVNVFGFIRQVLITLQRQVLFEAVIGKELVHLCSGSGTIFRSVCHG